MVWSGDGRSILFDQRPAGGAGLGVLRIPADGGAASLVFSARGMQMVSFDLSPPARGSRMSPAKGPPESALDNVLSALK